MRRIVTYSTFLISSLLVILILATARSYEQLLIAVLSYIPIAIISLILFLIKPSKKTHTFQQVEGQPVQSSEEDVEIADVDKRAFLKMIGLAGASFFLFSFLQKKSGLSVFGNQQGPTTTSVEDASGKKIDPAERQPTDGFKICEIDDDVITYYGFTNKDGAWLIMREDTDTNSFRYAKGDTDFSTNWSKHTNLSYDYYHNVF
jgi:hypothetical protein